MRLHPNEENYWSIELCFVNVPIKGAKRDTVHLIEEALAMQYLESARIDRFRLALASKPNDVFFLCHVPSQNLDNRYNETASTAASRQRQLGASHLTARAKVSTNTRSRSPANRTLSRSAMADAITR